MFLFRGREGEEKKEEDNKPTTPKDNLKNSKVKGSPRVAKLFGVPLETVPLVEAKAADDSIYHVPIVVKETVDWLRTHKGTFALIVNFLC
jgi:hypothetical protein